MFTLRFDMRLFQAAATDLCVATIDMCAWAGTRGAVIAVLSEHHGTDGGKPADESLALLLRLLRGQPVDYGGRRIHVTPAPVTTGGPFMLVAGGSKAAARRAAKHGLGFISETDSPGLKEFYESECRASGHEPGVTQFPVPGAPRTVFVADDVDRAWAELGPYLLHDAVTAWPNSEESS
jgi:alkanesulfonate monooxygenase SsuD/methylene tetrahydromethanopterin reductase-like flavin-dependent oxidoreductase (luciferase family)